MKKYFWSFAVIFLLSTIDLFAQNKVNNLGLKCGFWKTNVVIDGGIQRLNEYSGNYKIISKKELNNVSAAEYNSLKINEFGKPKIVSVDSIVDNFVSVKDGIWIVKDSSNRIVVKQKFIDGVFISDSLFNINQQLITSNELNFKKREITFSIYSNNKIFKQMRFSFDNNLNQFFTVYYPNRNLILNSAELDFTNDFNYWNSSYNTLKIATKQALEITSIKTSSENIEIFHRWHNTNIVSESWKKSLPIKIAVGDTVYFDIYFHPLPKSVKHDDTIFITTSETTKNEYLIFCRTNAYHLSYEGFGFLKEKKISKSKDEFLVVDANIITNLIFRNENGFVKKFDLRQLHKIPLNEFDIGIYDLELGCDNCLSSENHFKLTIIP